MSRAIVVLPDPEGPTSAHMERAGTLMLTPRRTGAPCRYPKTTSSSTTSLGAVSAALASGSGSTGASMTSSRWAMRRRRSSTAKAWEPRSSSIVVKRRHMPIVATASRGPSEPPRASRAESAIMATMMICVRAPLMIPPQVSHHSVRRPAASAAWKARRSWG